jgi:hypothetical protein
MLSWVVMDSLRHKYTIGKPRGIVCMYDAWVFDWIDMKGGVVLNRIHAKVKGGHEHNRKIHVAQCNKDRI